MALTGSGRCFRAAFAPLDLLALVHILLLVHRDGLTGLTGLTGL